MERCDMIWVIFDLGIFTFILWNTVLIDKALDT